MCVHGHGRVTKGGVTHDISCFSADTGQGFQFFLVIWNSAVMFLNYYLAGLDDIFGFTVKQADSLDVLF